jgi:hypothetical protein
MRKSKNSRLINLKACTLPYQSTESRLSCISNQAKLPPSFSEMNAPDHISTVKSGGSGVTASRHVAGDNHTSYDDDFDDANFNPTEPTPMAGATDATAAIAIAAAREHNHSYRPAPSTAGAVTVGSPPTNASQKWSLSEPDSGRGGGGDFGQGGGRSTGTSLSPSKIGLARPIDPADRQRPEGMSHHAPEPRTRRGSFGSVGKPFGLSLWPCERSTFGVSSVMV